MRELSDLIKILRNENIKMGIGNRPDLIQRNTFHAKIANNQLNK